MDKGLKHFSKEGRQVTDKHMKKCSILLIIKEMLIKTWRHHFTLFMMATIQKLEY